MDKYIQEIQNAIEKAAIDGALTKDAVEQFHDLIGECEEFRDANKKLSDRVESKEKENRELTSRLTVSQGLNKIAAEMEAAIINREQKMTELELTAKHEAKRVEDHQNMFGLVFRNAVIRNSVLGQELVAIPGTPDTVDQYGVRQYGSGREPDVTGVPVSKTEEKTET